MNHIYRSIWNESTGTVTAVSEHAKSRGKKNSSGKRAVVRSGRVLQSVSVAVALSCGSAAYASPTGGVVVAGNASITSTPGNTTINQTTQNTVLNWQSFDIGATEAVRFVQPNSHAVALNRVLGADPSNILGSLSSNGKVFLVNPNGILFGTNAQVNVGGLVVSTRNITDSDFMAGRYAFNGTSAGSVENRGSIHADGGYVALLGAKVSNEGIIAARLGTVALAAGNAFTLDVAGDGLLNVAVDAGAVNALAGNGGVIQADGGQILMTAGSASSLLQSAVNNTGLIQAQTIENRNGTIKLLGDMQSGTVNVAGTLDASAPNGGDGGFIDTSAALVNVASGTKVTTAAAQGLTGSWLIDPTDYTIAASGGNITGAQLSSDLTSTNVTIQSSSGSSGSAGDVNVNDTVAWSANRLTLNAQNNINISTAMNGSGTASLALEYGQGAIAAGNTSAVNVNAPVNLPAGNNFSTLQGSNGTVINYTVITSLGAAGSTTGTDLQGMGGNLAGRYVLGSDIDAAVTSTWNAGAGFTPIGTDPSRFTGIFDGLGHTVSGLFISRTGSNFIGLFGYTAAGSMVRNIGLTGGSVDSDGWSTGSLIGALGGTVKNSYATGTVRGFQTAGGLVGVIDGGAIIDSYATGDVVGYGNGEAGGLVGLIWGAPAGSVSNSYATGNVSSPVGNVGGLVGINWGTVTNSYATGKASGTDYIGGLIGNNSNGSFSNSYATGAVTGSNRVGGLAGNNSNSITNSYATGAVTGSVSVGGAVGSNYGTLSNSYATGNVSGGFVTGGLIGTNRGTVSYSHATGTVMGGDQTAGLVGGNQNGSISYSYATGDVTASTGASGGLVGYSSAPISNSYATGAVSGVSGVGGILGAMNGSSVTNSYASGAVTGTAHVGGVVGNSTNGTITNTYSSGLVTGSTNVGGLLGSNVNATVTNSYWDLTTSGQATSAAGTGLTTVQMRTPANFAGFNFTTTTGASGNNWVIVNADGSLNNATGGTRPMLASEYSTIITNGHQLQLMRMNLAASYTLATSLELGAEMANPSSIWGGGSAGFAPIGGVFTGSFDGLGHTIAGLIINQPSRSYVGLFSATGAAASIRNIGLVSGSVIGNSYTGGIAGRNGGLISNSYATINVSGSAYVGGLVGYGMPGSTVSNAYATGTVTSVRAGGLVGRNDGTISNTYATGAVSGSNSGGLTGLNNGGTIVNSFWNTETSGRPASDGGTGLTTSQMQDAANFSGFNFTGTPGATGNAWVMVDVDGSLNNAGGAAAATLPILASEYSTTISNAHQLQLMSMDLAASYTLGQNINAAATGTANDVWSGSTFIPVGKENARFTGTLNGLGHTIANLNINRPGEGYIGLFGFVASAGSVRNVGLVGGSVIGGGNVGQLVGRNEGTVISSYATGTVQGDVNVGGLIGTNWGAVSDSYANAAVHGNQYIGGLVGFNEVGTITNSHAGGAVSGGNYVGGLAGRSSSVVGISYATGAVQGGAYVGGLLGTNDGTLSNSYATGAVSSSDITGGLVGFSYGASLISNSYATGAVSGGGGAVGGLVGFLNAGTITSSFWNIDSSGQATSSGGTGLTAAAMMQIASFNSWNTTTPNTIASAGSSGAIWRIYEGHTAPLLTQFLTALTLTDIVATYDGAAHNAASAVASGVFGAIQTNAGFYNGFYSNQQGYDLTGGSLTINRANLTLSGTRTYDGSTAFASNALTATGVAGESFAVTGSGNASNLTSKNVQTGSTLATVTGLSLGAGVNGGISGNYNALSTTGSSVSIARAALTLAASNVIKTYDGNLTALGTATVASGTLFGADAISGGTFAFTDKNAGNGNKTVTATSVTVTDGNGGGNYNVSYVNNTTSTIDRAVLTATITAADKSYDGNVTAAVTLSAFNGLIGTEMLNASHIATFNSKDVAAANLVTVNSISLVDGSNGGLASNYTLASGQTAVAHITPKALTATVTAPDKDYDGNTTANAALNALSGLIGSETLAASNTATFNSKNVTSANLVTVNSIALSDGSNGGLASNYSLASGQTAVAHITPKTLTATVVAPDKIYDGNTTASASLNALNGLIGSETVQASGAATFNSKDVASASLVTVNSTALSDGTHGGLASNYSLASGQTAVAHITPQVLTVVNQLASDKVYDGTTTATLHGGSLAGVIAGETVSLGEGGNFVTADAGNGIAVTAADSLSGIAAANYTLTQPVGLAANITAAVQPDVPPVVVTLPPVDVVPSPVDAAPPQLAVTSTVAYTSAVGHVVSNSQIAPPPTSVAPPLVAPSNGSPATGPMMTYDLSGLNLTVISSDGAALPGQQSPVASDDE